MSEIKFDKKLNIFYTVSEYGENMFIDDALMYCVGALLGVGIKLMFDSIRGMLTSGRDPSFLSYEYVPVPRKSTKSPQIVEE